MNAKETLAVLQAKQSLVPDQVPEAKINPNTLGYWWTKLVARESDAFVPPLTKKQFGQLGHYIKKVGKDKAYLVMRNVIADWHEFKVQVKEAKAITIGNAPNIDVLLTHADIAVTIDPKLVTKTDVQLIAKPPKAIQYVFGDGEKV